MQITDMRKLAAGSVVTSGICIVGSGPAGFALARELAGTLHDVLVLESGGRFKEDAFSADLNEIESSGAPRVMNQRRVRNRILGGTSHTWSGRCTSFDTIDYERRAWVSCSGWPVQAEEMLPFVQRSEKYLGLVPAEYDDTLLEEVGLSRRFERDSDTELRSVFWQFSRRSSINDDYVRFGSSFTKLNAPNVRVMTSATVTNIATDASGSHVEALEIKSPSGAVCTVKSRYFVLCGGGIENARMMLASNRINPQGVGNGNGLVGRFLMDHPRAVVGTFASSDIPSVQSEFGLFKYKAGSKVQRGLSLSLATQRRENLLNCAAWTTQHVAEDDAWRALRSIGRSNGADRVALGRTVLRHADQIVQGAWNKFVRGHALPRRMKQLDLDVMIEQAPDATSRISLSDRKDALGVPLSRIDWKIGELERLTTIRLAHAVHDALAHVGLPTPVLVDWVRDRRPEDAVFSDPAHPIGTTRMATCPDSGVVDPDGKVFGVDNLYIAGSSVFPTGGHANPTLMIVALTLRLADMLRSLKS